MAIAWSLLFSEASSAERTPLSRFLGLDLRVSKSGQSDGPRRLTKRGDPEARRLLHNAAMSGSRTPAWKPFMKSRESVALVQLKRWSCSPESWLE
ncbi:Transposase [Pseudomonas syringae pv. syringae HS191]|nr:Transposase [Pseudomonas syringae pv. syringae HS191]